MDEKWLPIDGYGDCYEVSNLGRVRRVKRPDPRPKKPPTPGKRIRIRDRTIPFVPYVLRTFPNSKGYPQLKIGPKDIATSISVHRLVATAFLPNPDNLPEVNHIDGNKGNPRIDNLEWVSRSRNVAHGYETGLSKITIGENARNAKLTDSDVYAIRSDTRKNVDIAAEYGVSRHRIWSIKAGRSWTHLP